MMHHLSKCRGDSTVVRSSEFGYRDEEEEVRGRRKSEASWRLSTYLSLL